MVLCVTNRQDINLHDITNSIGDDDIRSEESLKNSDDRYLQRQCLSCWLLLGWTRKMTCNHIIGIDTKRSGKSSEDSLDIVIYPIHINAKQ